MIDLELCIEALKLDPDLWHATQLVARAQGKPVFPIVSIEALIDVLRDKDQEYCELEGVKLTTWHAFEYFPIKFLPIEDEDDMLKKIYAALCWGQRMHQAESQIEIHKQSVSFKGGV